MNNFSRRDFLKWASLMGGASLFAGCNLFPGSAAVPKFIEGAPAVDPTENIDGVLTVYSVCGMCPGNCGIACRVAQGMLVKIGGNPLDSSTGLLTSNSGKTPPLSSSLCAIGGTGIQLLYDPFRIAKPLKRVGPRGSGKWSAIPWETAVAEICAGGAGFSDTAFPGLARIKSDARPLGILTNKIDAGSQIYLTNFAQAFGSADLLKYGSQEEEISKRASERVFGRADAPLVDYSRAATVVSFGDAPLDSGIPLVSLAREIADARMNRTFTQWAVIDPRLTVSASKADLWVPIKPGQDLNFALAVARRILDKKQSSGLKNPDLQQRILAKTPAQHAESTGIGINNIETLADMIIQAGPKSAIVPGSGVLNQENGLEAAEVIYAINTLVGSQPGTGGPLYYGIDVVSASQSSGNSGKQISGPTPQIASNAAYEAMILWKADPVYQDPSLKLRLKDPKEVPLLVGIDTHITETSSLADYILPDTTYLERYDLCSSNLNQFSGVGVRKPVVGVTDSEGKYFPILPDNRLMESILSQIGGHLNLEGYDAGKQNNIVNTPAGFYTILLANVLDFMNKYGSKISGSKENVESVVKAGGYFTAFSKDPQGINPAPRKLWPVPQSTEMPPGLDDEFMLIRYSQPFHRTPMAGMQSWLMEIMPENRLLINNVDANRLNIAQNQIVKIENRSLKSALNIKVLVLPGIRPGTLAIAKGFGYTQAGVTAFHVNDRQSTVDTTRGAGVNSALLTGATGTAWVKIQKA